MKQLIITLVALFAFAFAALAQAKPGKAVISTPGAHCEYCKKRIEEYVASQYGVTSVNVDLKKKTTTVTWIPDRTNIEEVKTYIANRGYDADDVEAEPTMYFRLPKACQTKPAPQISVAVDSTAVTTPVQ